MGPRARTGTGRPALAGLVVVVGGILISGCELARGTQDQGVQTMSGGTAAGPGPSSIDDETSAPNEHLRVIDEDEAALVRGVSNQSFDDPDVDLVLTIDGTELVSESFPVEDQHTVTYVGVDAASGPHTVTVTSDTGATSTEAVDLLDGERRWIYITYWYSILDPAQENVTWGDEQAPGPHIIITISEEFVPIA